MKVIIDGREYSADTAIGLIDEIKGMNWAAKPDTDAEGYIAIQESTCKRMFNKKLKLPKGDTEARALAMFEELAKMDAWAFEKGE